MLANADTCMLASKWEMEKVEASARLRSEPQTSPWNTIEQARGILAHRYAAEVMATMWERGHTSIDVSQALEILYEVAAQRTMRQADGERIKIPDADVVYIPARERRLLRMFAVLLVYNPKTGKPRQWQNIGMLQSIEERLWAKIRYDHPDGGTVERLITGQPDATLLGGPGELVVLDWKSTPKAPAAPKESKMQENGDFLGDDVPNNVSYEGYFQQRVYGLLELANNADFDRVTLREIYPMDPDGLQVRKATVLRDDLERIVRDLSITTELLDRAVAGGSESGLWKPTPGKHCLTQCSRPGDCPIPKEERRLGSIDSPEMAAEYAQDLVVAQGVYDHRRAAVKAYHEQTGHPVPVKTSKGRLEFRFKEGTRSFGMFVPTDSDRGPEDPNLAGAFRAAAERRKAAQHG